MKLTRILLLPFLLGTALVPDARSAANLLLNGNFEEFAPDRQTVAWSFDPTPRPAGALTVMNSPAGNVVLRLGRTTPDGNNGVTPPALVARQHVELPPATGPVRLILKAWLARDPAQPGPDEGVEFALRLPNDNGSVESAFAPATDLIPADGLFHPIMATLVVPPAPPFSNPPEFLIRWKGSGRCWVDGLELATAPSPFQLQPAFGSGAEPGPVQILSPLLGSFGDRVFFGQQPAEIAEAQRGRLMVFPPPAPPGPVDVRVITQSGNTLQSPSAFRYLRPLVLDAIRPNPIAAGTLASLELQGNGFGPGLQLTLGNVPVDTTGSQVASPGRILVPLPPLEPGSHELTLTDPYGRLAAAPRPLQVIAPPRVESVQPASGPAQGGTPVQIQGASFEPGAAVLFGRTPAAEIQLTSPHSIRAITPPLRPGLYDVTIVLPNGVAGRLPDAFVSVDRVKGDVNADEVIDLQDVVLALRISSGDPVTSPLSLLGDVNRDGALGLAEALFALEASEPYNPAAYDAAPRPTLTRTAGPVTHGRPVIAAVAGLGVFAPGRIHWGDGFSSVVVEDGPALHTYDRPGTYVVRMESAAGTTPRVEVSVVPVSSLRVETLSLSMTGVDRDGRPIQGNLAQVDGLSPLAVHVRARASGVGVVTGSLRLNGPSGNDWTLPVELDFTTPAPDARTMEFTATGIVLTVPGEYAVSFTPGPDLDAPLDARHPDTLTVQLPAFVTEEDCRELEEQLRRLEAQKAAQKNSCDDLARKLADLLAQKAALEAEQAALQEKRDGLQGQLEGKQAEYTKLFNSVQQFLAGAGQLVEYSTSADFPAGSNYVGSRNKGASSGVGVAFGDAQDLIDRLDLYKGIHGHSIGKDLNKLRDCISQMDGLKAEIAQADAKAADLQQALAALNQQIADLERLLEECKRQCGVIEQAIQDLIDAHKRCLEKLGKQKKAGDAIRDAEDAGADASDASDAAGAAGTQADDTIDGRAGTPGETKRDKDEVAGAGACKDQADGLIRRGEAKLAEARAALQRGDTDAAEQLAAEAKALFAQAKEKLAEAEAHIRAAEARARQRKARECVDGEYRQGQRYDRKVWTEIYDIALAPMGTSPEQWASSLENADAILEGINKVLAIQEAAGDLSPIAGPVTPQAGDVARKIVDAHIELFKRRFPFDVYIRVRGHTAWHRVDQRCVNGCWEPVEVSGDDDDVCEDRLKIGTIWGGNRAEREKQLQDILQQFARSQR